MLKQKDHVFTNQEVKWPYRSWKEEKTFLKYFRSFSVSLSLSLKKERIDLVCGSEYHVFVPLYSSALISL